MNYKEAMSSIISFNKLNTATSSIYFVSRTAILLASILALVYLYIFTVTRISGSSMQPTLRHDDYVFVDKLSYWWNEPKHSDIVMLRFPGDPDKVRYIKRIIALPGELVTIRDRKVYINNNLLIEDYIAGPIPTNRTQEWRLGADEYFLLGDNRLVSNDSRDFGPVERRFLLGQARLVIWPPKSQAWISSDILP